MTTYTLNNGIANYYDVNLDEDVGVKFNGITLEIVVPDTTTSFSYSLLPLGPGDVFPEDVYVDTVIDDYTVRLNGETVGDNLDFDESIFAVSWSFQGSSGTSGVYIAETQNDVVPVFGLVDTSNVFLITGDALPVFANFAEWLSFLNTGITNFAIPTGIFAPDQDILLSNLSAVVTENDVVEGDNTNNLFRSGVGNDQIEGFGGNDTLFGDGGRDTLFGGSGNDTLNGGGGNDDMFGGSGNDRYIVNAAGDRVYETTTRNSMIDTGGTDTVFSSVSLNLTAYSGAAFVEKLTLTGAGGLNGIGNAQANVINGNSGANTLSGKAGADILRGNNGNDKLIGGSENDTLYGGAGNDTLAGDAGNDKLFGSSGTDTLLGGAGNDTLYGEGDHDKLFGGGDTDMLFGGAGNDTVYGGGAGDKLVGAAGDDKLFGGFGDDTLFGNGGDDTVVGDSGLDTIYGGGGNDIIRGGTGGDSIFGSTGQDRIYGETGKDILVGGADIDTFVFTDVSHSVNNVTGADIIKDFAQGVDKIALNAIDASTILAGNNAFTFNGMAGFTMAAAGEIFYNQVDNAGNANDYTMVNIDIDNDTFAEMKIRLNGLIDLTADDFVL